MTQISFHVNVPDALPYACRLLRKAYRVGARVLVTGSGRQLQQLDQLLWTFDPLEFVPHGVLGPDDGTEVDEATPIWLSERVAQTQPAATVLLNLGDGPVALLAQFDKLIEIVPASEAQREAGRRRWKHYVSAGYSPDKHEAQQ
jgi:DNA polymerase III subunit chi